MFTGIVRERGTVRGVERTDDGHRLQITAALAADLAPGDSLAVDGTCLTVEERDDEAVTVFLATETREKTTLGTLAAGDPVNLEPALPADGRLDGHFVQGHVDTTTELLDIERHGEDWTFTWALPDGHAAYVAPKGSIALDGVSLTVAERDDERFTTAIIPETYERTTFGGLAAGDRVNVEVDILAKYVGQLTRTR
jgi:riboflavin synthase